MWLLVSTLNFNFCCFVLQNHNVVVFFAQNKFKEKLWGTSALINSEDKELNNSPKSTSTVQLQEIL